MRRGIVVLAVGVGLVLMASAATFGARETAIWAGFVGGGVCAIWGAGLALDARAPKVEHETPESPVRPGL